MSTLVRAQLKPVAGQWEMLYSAGSSAVISTLRACNTGGKTDKVSVRFALEAEEDILDAQYVLHECLVPPGWPYSVTEGLVLDEADVVWVKSEKGLVAFSIYGQERS